MAKILLCLSWGTQYPKPGLSNEALADCVARIKDTYDYILTQIEITEALSLQGYIPDFSVGEPGVYINTYTVINRMVQWLQDQNIDPATSDIWILCHQTHWTGCKLVLRKFQIKAKRVPVSIPYDPQSQHWYTRSPTQAFLGKIIRGFLYSIRGEI